MTSWITKLWLLLKPWNSSRVGQYFINIQNLFALYWFVIKWPIFSRSLWKFLELYHKGKWMIKTAFHSYLTPIEKRYTYTWTHQTKCYTHTWTQSGYMVHSYLDSPSIYNIFILYIFKKKLKSVVVILKILKFPKKMPFWHVIYSTYIGFT